MTIAEQETPGNGPPAALPIGEPAAPVAEAIPMAAEATSETQAPAQVCPHCHAPRDGSQTYCGDCGWVFPADEPASTLATAPLSAAPATRIRERYELGQQISERAGVVRLRGLDHGAGGAQPVPVIIVRALQSDSADAEPAAQPASPSDDIDFSDIDIIPSFETPGPPGLAVTEILRGKPTWPSIAWERTLLTRSHHAALPSVLDTFIEAGWEYLIEEMPTGQVLWDAWDEPAATNQQRYGWLKQVAEGLQMLHRAGAIVEALRPDIIVVTTSGQAKLADLSDLLPLPLPPQPPIRATLYTAPELVVAADRADARSDLYSFGAMMYALHAGRELSEVDFDRQGVPKPFIPRFPDVHPALGRLITKTFCRDVEGRFPSDEAAKEDSTGFGELVRTLEVCRRTLDNVRLEIAAWTTTGIVRTGNEDAFAVLHAVESRQDDLGESALLLLADGMGGYEAGEVAAALAIQALRKNLLQQKPFVALAGGSTFPAEGGRPDPDAPGLDVAGCKQLLTAALKDANKQVFTASRSGVGRRGMGCTAEVVFLTGHHLLVGHVGDSRTYHLHQGRLNQVTRDQTLVNRLLELGSLTPEEAETHPRRNELQQAIGGRSEVEPAVYHCAMKPGDWVIVCSDGLSNHINGEELQQMLDSEATSADMAARRLVNFANVRGATDNATVVVVRVT